MEELFLDYWVAKDSLPLDVSSNPEKQTTRNLLYISLL